jgi:asparagine synthase (glutamine-hydrolysing)
LNGDGGDESFAGYERYLANRVAEQFQRLPGSRAAAHALSRLLPDSLNRQSRLRQARRFFGVAALPMIQRYSHWLTFFARDAKQQLYGEALRPQLNGDRPHAWLSGLFAEASGLDPVDAAMAVDVLSYLPYDLLVKVDITSMANSLEARSPFLDHEVMELAACLPVRMKLNGSTSKYLLKRAFADILPRENSTRRKMGFGVPVGRWFRGPLRDLVCDSLLSHRGLGRGYFQPAALKDLVRQHMEGRADHTMQLWCLLMLELWHGEFLDAPAAACVH